MTPSPPARLQLRADNVVWREVEDELLVLELTTTTYLTLNGSAKLLWLMLADGSTADEMTGVLIDLYGIPVAQARSDAESFVSELAERDLLDNQG